VAMTGVLTHLSQCWVSASKNLFLPDMRFNPEKMQIRPTGIVVFSLTITRLPCILQVKHCNTHAHFQPCQLLFKVCINTNENCICEAKIRLWKLR